MRIDDIFTSSSWLIKLVIYLPKKNKNKNKVGNFSWCQCSTVNVRFSDPICPWAKQKMLNGHSHLCHLSLKGLNCYFEFYVSLSSQFRFLLS